MTDDGRRTTDNTGGLWPQKAFTLVELIVVVILLGAIAGFALPNYTRSIQRAHEQDMVAQLTTIHAANLMYRTRNDTYWDTGGAVVNDLAIINNTLGLNIISNDGTTYAYSSPAGGATYTAEALWVFGPNNYLIRVRQIGLATGGGSPNPCCVNANCLPNSIPSC